jgi:uncharacterized membrane protein
VGIPGSTFPVVWLVPTGEEERDSPVVALQEYKGIILIVLRMIVLIKKYLHTYLSCVVFHVHDLVASSQSSYDFGRVFTRVESTVSTCISYHIACLW